MKRFMAFFMACVLCLTFTAIPAFAAENEHPYTDEETAVNNEQRSELREMWGNHTVDSRYANVPATCSTSIGSCGDILIALDSITDHVGIVVDAYTVIEAHPDNPNGGVDYRDNDWPSRYNRIKGMSVDGATEDDKSNAVGYANLQIGEPYDLLSGRWTTDKWYCSKLVWRAWYEQGFDLEGRNLELRGTHVTPGDILDSPLTTVFHSQG